MENKKLIVPDEIAISNVYYIREQKVMLDSDLAELYGIETRRLNEQVNRNIDRFPEDFMLQSNEQEFKYLMSQINTPIFYVRDYNDTSAAQMRISSRNVSALFWSGISNNL